MARTASNTAAPLASNLNSLANSAAKVLGEFDVNTAGSHELTFKMQATLASSGVATTGTIELWAITSQQNSVDWDDGIDPTSTSDISASMKNAKRIDVLDANVNSQVVESTVDLFSRLGSGPGFVCMIAINKSGAALPASGHDANYQSIVFS